MKIEVLIAPTSRHLTTVTTAMIELQLGNEGEIRGFVDLISAASDACADYCRILKIGGENVGFGRAVLRQTERLSSPRDCILLPRFLPASFSGTVGAYTLGITEAGTTLNADEYELQDGGRVIRLSDGAPINWAVGTTTLTYTSGYALLGDAPYSLERACILTLAEMYAQRGNNPGLRSQNNGLIAETFMTPVAGVPPQAAKLLDSFVHWSL